MDHQLGRLLDFVDRSFGAEEVVTIFTSDHGETFDEHPGYMDHGFNVYDTSIHIPLIVAGAGVAPGRVVGAVTGNIDIAPTLLDIAGLPVPADYEGRSLAPSFGSGPPADLRSRRYFSEATKPHGQSPGWPNRELARCVIAERWKIVHWPREAGWELYDRSSDPDERHDLWQESSLPPERRDELAEALLAWSKQSPEHELTDPAPSREQIERLQAIGYVE
jgi:arylsulfatase A-like enzyme